MSEQKFLIWSEEHGAWWREARAGYTRTLYNAGRYSEKEAREIVLNANRYAVPLSKPIEIAFPEPLI